MFVIFLNVFQMEIKGMFLFVFSCKTAKIARAVWGQSVPYFPTSTCSACVIPKNFKKLSITHLHVFIVSIYFLKTDNFIVHAASGLDNNYFKKKWINK